MKLGRTLPIAAIGLLMSSGAFAMFRAANLVVVPTAASTAGLNGSNWRTDVEILNVDTVSIDVEIVMLECCLSDNSVWFANIKNHLGGRTSDGFGHIDAKLENIPPGQAVYISDVVGTSLGLSGVKGALLVFAYQAGTLLTTTPPGGNPKNIVVNTRTYTSGTNASNQTFTYGQETPGLPWYDYLDPGLKSKGLDHVTFTGLREDTAYRTAFGLVNVSDRTTTLAVVLTLKDQGGTQLAQQTLTMPPLGHYQADQAIINFFGKTLADAIQGASLTVTASNYQSGAQYPAPALMAYVTRTDNVSNDSLYLEQIFTQPLQWDCVFNGNCVASTAGLSLNPSPTPANASPLRPPTPLAP